MKKRILCTVIMICSMIISQAQESLSIDTFKSEIKWSCDYTFYFGGHFGSIDFKEGNFIVTDGEITGGRFIINMNSIKAKDMNEEGNTSLSKHLKNDDFFDVEKFPEASLVITKTEYHDHKSFKGYANLTIMGKTETIEFQAEINHKELYMTTKFKVDRTRWGINYNTELKDRAISDAIGLEVKLSLHTL